LLGQAKGLMSKANALSVQANLLPSHPRGLSVHARGLSPHPKGLPTLPSGLSPHIYNAAPLTSHWLAPEWNKPVTTRIKPVGAMDKVEAERGKALATNIKRVATICIYLIADAWVQ